MKWLTHWLSRDVFAVCLVLIALMSLTSVYRHPLTHAHKRTAFERQSTPTQQRNLKSTDISSAAPTQTFTPIPAPVYTRQPINADRTLSPRRLPGSYYNRPPPASLS